MALPPLDIDPAAIPPVVRIGVGGLGALTLLFGERLYKPTLYGSAFAVGVVFAVAVAGWLPAGTLVGPGLWIACAVCGLAAVGLAAMAHKAALLATGAVVGVLAGAGVAAALGLAPWVPLVGAGVGAIVLPLLYKPVIKVVSALVGAVLVTWAAGMHEILWAVAGVWLLGAVFQLAGRRDRSARRDDRR